MRKWTIQLKQWTKDLIRNLTKEDIHVANKHMRRCSTSDIIKEMQVKTMRYHYTHTRMAKIKTLTAPNADKDVEQKEPSFTAVENTNYYNHFRRWFSHFVNYKISKNILLPHHVCYIYPTELKAYVHIKICIQVFKKWSEVIQLCPTLWDPMDCSLPGSSIHGIFQARIME